MTVKEKSQELVNKFWKIGLSERMYLHDAKQCSLVAVEEIILTLDNIELLERGVVIGGLGQDYWQDVKVQIQSL